MHRLLVKTGTHLRNEPCWLALGPTPERGDFPLAAGYKATDATPKPAHEKTSQRQSASHSGRVTAGAHRVRESGGAALRDRSAIRHQPGEARLDVSLYRTGREAGQG